MADIPVQPRKRGLSPALLAVLVLLVVAAAVAVWYLSQQPETAAPEPEPVGLIHAAAPLLA